MTTEPVAAVPISSEAAGILEPVSANDMMPELDGPFPMDDAVIEGSRKLNTQQSCIF